MKGDCFPIYSFCYEAGRVRVCTVNFFPFQSISSQEYDISWKQHDGEQFEGYDYSNRSYEIEWSMECGPSEEDVWLCRGVVLPSPKCIQQCWIEFLTWFRCLLNCHGVDAVLILNVMITQPRAGRASAMGNRTVCCTKEFLQHTQKQSFVLKDVANWQPAQFCGRELGEPKGNVVCRWWWMVPSIPEFQMSFRGCWSTVICLHWTVIGRRIPMWFRQLL